MSRTGLIDGLTPRRSRRLLTNGYYQQTSDEESVADTSDAESVASNNGERRLHYHESPLKKVFNMRHKVKQRNKGSDSPNEKTAYLNRTTVTGRQTRHHHVEVEVNDQSEVTHEQQHDIVNVASTSSHRQFERSQAIPRRRPRGRPPASVMAAGEGTEGMSRKNKQALLNNHTSVANNESHSQSNHNLEKNVLDGMIFEKHQRQTKYISRNQTVIQENNQQQFNISAGVNHSASFSDNEQSFISSSSQSRNASLRRSDEVSFISKIQRFIYCNILYKMFKLMTWLVTIDAWLLSRRTKVGHTAMKLLHAMFYILLASLFCYWFLLEDGTPTGITAAIKNISLAVFTLPSTASTYLSAISVQTTPPQSKMNTETPKLSHSEVDLEQAYYKIELMVADQIAKIHSKIDDMHAKITSETEARILLERKLAAENHEVYREKTREFESKMEDEREAITQTKQEFKTDIEKLQSELMMLRSNMTSDNVRSKAEFDQLHKLLSSSSESNNKLIDFNSRLTALDARINNLHGMLMKVMSDFDAHIGNTTFISNIAKVQFVKSFLQLLQDNRDDGQDMTEGQQNLHYLFLAWLNKQGYVKVETINEQQIKLQMNISNNAEEVEARIMKEIRKLQSSLEKQSEKLTLNTLVTENKRETNIVTSEVTEKLIRQIMTDELALYSADRTGKADFALESVGGTIVNTRCSESYIHSRAVFSVMGIPLHYKVQSPRTIIQPSTMPGDCWAFKGTSGFVVIKLSQPVVPSSFTFEHIPRQLSPDGKIESAPQDFSVYGLKDENDPDGMLLGTYRYEEYGTPLQPFKVTEKNPPAFDFIELRVLSNWGNQVFTCLYRFRVHGNVPTST